MTGKYIKTITFLSLIIIVVIQGAWLVNTYRMIETQLLQTSNRLFPQAVLDEAQNRLERLTNAQKEELTLNFSADFNRVQQIDQKVYSDLIIVMNQYADSVYQTGIDLSSADSIFTNYLVQEGYQAQLHCELIDSTGSALQTEEQFAGKYSQKILRTIPVYLNKEHSTAIQAVILNPYWIAFRQMSVLLIATVLLIVFVAGCIIYQVKIIIRQNRIARLRQDFTYAMIHDMKTPITTISMVGHTLESGLMENSPKLKKQYFAILKEESSHLLNLSEKILTIAKLEQSRLKFTKDLVDLPKLFDELIQKYTIKTEKNVTFQQNCQITSPLIADEEYLKEAISNLIDNSLKYSDDDVLIRLSAEERENTFFISVWDNGWGIPLKQQKRIFEKFQRGGLEYKKEKKVSGFGLGLNYVYKVITAMGGNVTVESIEGKYSEFTLTLPVQNENV